MKVVKPHISMRCWQRIRILHCSSGCSDARFCTQKLRRCRCAIMLSWTLERARGCLGLIFYYFFLLLKIIEVSSWIPAQVVRPRLHDDDRDRWLFFCFVLFCFFFWKLFQTEASKIDNLIWRVGDRERLVQYEYRWPGPVCPLSILFLRFTNNYCVRLRTID